MLVGFEHAAIAAKNAQKLAEWYIKTFELEVVFDDGKTPPTYLLKAPDGTILEILPATSGEPCDYDQRSAGIRHLALTVDDFEVALQRLQNSGITEFFDDRRSDNYELIFFRDPEGNLLHLMWRPKPL